MHEAEQRGLPYLFKLRLTANVKRMIARLAPQRAWTPAGQGFEAKDSMVRLEGWSRQRRAITRRMRSIRPVLRRRVKGALAASMRDEHGQLQLSVIEIGAGDEI